MSDMDYGQRLREVRFTPTRFSGGYDMAEVDEFLDDLAGLVEGRPAGPELDGDIAHAISGARFTPVRSSSGYDMGEVDVFLDEFVTSEQREAAFQARWGDLPQDLHRYLDMTLPLARWGTTYDPAAVQAGIEEALEAVAGAGGHREGRAAGLEVLTGLRLKALGRFTAGARGEDVEKLLVELRRDLGG